ncbi:ankyrin repeat domain-containing protein [Paenibacillus harenae]|uniref:Ankyrin repeat protein/preprotein translocase subunit YajC n=1 Tax=Paenibacillus harenae TaxID=306543 RepID=A0ABT9U2R2_PAEHA|nr:ankyrin repeat domain-containing protein [Paenibacillus harenae]MDQ0113912.1 ankyrin repeat protein/preprotein translocase subunit YajC [Paenibacillus harenae]
MIVFIAFFIISSIFIVGGVIGLAENGSGDNLFMLLLGIAILVVILFFRKEARRTKRMRKWIMNNKEVIYNGGAEYEGELITPDTKLVFHELVISFGVTVTFPSRMVVEGSLNHMTFKIIYSLFTALFGWWSLPWGPSETIRTLRNNMNGGNATTPHDIIFYYGEGRPRLKGQPKLVRAAYNNRLDRVHAMLHKGLDVHAKDRDGRTALHRAAENGNVEMLELLLMNGADLHEKDAYGCTLLIRASVHGRSDMVRKLLSLGLDPNEGDNHGSLPLVYAGSRGYTNVIRLLLNGKADPNKATDNGTTALMKAVECEEYWAVRMLLESGANPYAVHGDGETTAFSIAEECEDKRIKELLLDPNRALVRQ